MPIDESIINCFAKHIREAPRTITKNQLIELVEVVVNEFDLYGEFDAEAFEEKCGLEVF